MREKKHLRVNAFTMNTVGHINHGFWTHPRDRSTEYTRPEYWAELARTLEEGLFDAVFMADITGVYDTYQGGVGVTLKESVQLPVNDPVPVVAIMAAATRHLGFGITANPIYEPPYLLARRFSTLDHLSRGRVAWNVVTGYLDSAARAMGIERQLPHDERYQRAEEYLELVYRLWEGSWEDKAVACDRANRIYADPARVHAVSHQGRFYHCEGYHLSEPSPQRTPVLFQAGTSDRGIEFAAQHAECIFISGGNAEAIRGQVRRLRRAAVSRGRRADDLRIFVGMNVVVAGAQGEAEERYQEYLSYANPEAGLAHYSSTTGVDLSRYQLDEAIAYAGDGNAVQSVTRRFAETRLTRRDLLKQHALGGRYPTLVGDAVTVADQLEALLDDTDIDGINLARIVTPESYQDFIRWVVPELQSRGRYKTAYAPGTLREKLFGRGDVLADRHVGARYRHAELPLGDFK